jgi:hypothetical protein
MRNPFGIGPEERLMNRVLGLYVAGVMALSMTTQAQPARQPVQAVQPITAVRSATAIRYPEGLTLSIRFLGTHRLPEATGEAKVERKRA